MSDLPAPTSESSLHGAAKAVRTDQRSRLAPTSEGYFSALIRSSGLRIGNPAAVRDERRAASPELVEITEERETARVAAPGAMTPRQDRGPIAQAPEIVAIDARPQSAADLAAPGPIVRHDSHDRPAMPSTAIATASAPMARQSQPDASRSAPASRQPPDPVRTAMQWVAADPEARAALAETPRPSTPVATPRSAPTATHHEEVISERVDPRDRHAAPVDDAPSRPAAGQPAVRAIAAPPRTSLRENERITAVAPDRRRAAAVEDIVEISIGAINLHVEGPPPQTVIQSPPARRSPAAAARRHERSGLARRDLRSF